MLPVGAPLGRFRHSAASIVRPGPRAAVHPLAANTPAGYRRSSPAGTVTRPRPAGIAPARPAASRAGTPFAVFIRQRAAVSSSFGTGGDAAEAARGQEDGESSGHSCCRRCPERTLDVNPDPARPPRPADRVQEAAAQPPGALRHQRDQRVAGRIFGARSHDVRHGSAPVSPPGPVPHCRGPQDRGRSPEPSHADVPTNRRPPPLARLPAPPPRRRVAPGREAWPCPPPGRAAGPAGRWSRQDGHQPGEAASRPTAFDPMRACFAGHVAGGRICHGVAGRNPPDERRRSPRRRMQSPHLRPPCIPYRRSHAKGMPAPVRPKPWRGSGAADGPAGGGMLGAPGCFPGSRMCIGSGHREIKPRCRPAGWFAGKLGRAAAELIAAPASALQRALRGRGQKTWLTASLIPCGPREAPP